MKKIIKSKLKFTFFNVGVKILTIYIMKKKAIKRFSFSHLYSFSSILPFPVITIMVKKKSRTLLKKLEWLKQLYSANVK